MELHERMEGKQLHKEDNPVHAAFWMVIVQIVVLDAVFSLDSVITAVGMVKELSVMMVAVVIAVGIMLWASRPLMDFVNKHPTVVILCLGFLMMIGFSLVVEGFGFHIPKGYLYAAIGFSILVEMINQTMRRNQEKLVTTTDLRYRTASAVLRMLGSKIAVLLQTLKRLIKKMYWQLKLLLMKSLMKKMALTIVCLYKVYLVYLNVQ